MYVPWVVDVQHDFMHPSGSLCIPGAGRIFSPIAALVAQPLPLVVYTGDLHLPDDVEYQPPPARPEPFPRHCIVNTPGADLSPEMFRREDVDNGIHRVASFRDAGAFVGPGDLPDTVRAAVDAGFKQRRLFVGKRKFSVFEGCVAVAAVVDEIAQRLGPNVEFVVCGVAADVCVTEAVAGLVASRRRVSVVMDCMAGLGISPEEDLKVRWEAAGVRVNPAASSLMPH